MTKEAYWFKHDSNAKDDPKCIILIEELGLEGYGIFWVLVEMLRAQPDFKAPMRILPAIARRHNTSTEKVKAVVQRYELFEVEADEFFYSPSLIERMQPLLDKKEKLSIAGKKGANKRWNSGNDRVAIGEANGEAYSNKRREDKIREEKSKIPTLTQVQEYFTANGFQKELATRAYNMYNTSVEDNPKLKYWRDSRDNPIKNWKLKMQSVWFKNENKNKTNEQYKIIDGGKW